MNGRIRISKLLIGFLAVVLMGAAPSWAAIFTQCPGDTDGDLIPDEAGYANVKCVHITGGDGFAVMADGFPVYTFGFGLADHSDPGFDVNQVVRIQAEKSRLPAPLITVEEGQELYLTMTNVGMVSRPDLFDAHSVHWHGFPNAAPIFDGLPEPSPTANMGSSFTYYYNAAVPGTYFYHCHVEAAEHMQMGMIGQLWVYPKQDVDGYDVNGDGTIDANEFAATQGRRKGNTNPDAPYGYAYNDEDGSTAYDVEVPVQLTGFDPIFHEASRNVGTLPFAAMHDTYTMINGRGYPDTINTGALINEIDFEAQVENALIQAESGDRILLRLSNVSTTHQYAVATTLGVPMKMVGRGAALLRGPNGEDTSRTLSVINVGGGQAYDVIIDTGGVPAGTYFLYATSLENLSNDFEERGGLMTEIVITAAPAL